MYLSQRVSVAKVDHVVAAVAPDPLTHLLCNHKLELLAQFKCIYVWHSFTIFLDIILPPLKDIDDRHGESNIKKRDHLVR